MKSIFEKINTEEKHLAYASLSRRVYALILDSLILCPVWIPQIVVFYYHNKMVFELLPFYTAFHSLLYVGYKFVMHALYGRTIGKAFAGIIVTDSSKGRIGWIRSFVRIIPELSLSLATIMSSVYDSRIFMEHQTEMEGLPWAGVHRILNKLNPLDNFTFWDSILYYGISVLCIFLSQKRTALHDLLAGTRVLRFKEE
ncbi:RDD family protein [Leptospira koniambonensis]|uniref:RDD family protein n=1 Tax=Leptospira koniambonensis TaxID=2484950 RepID=A0A4R9J7X4_9LEPT|nr:RDD family protein [Leptospira koniambonensis]TGL33952.1 RDD family protein [Leptospira koniambonensis]